MAQADPLFGEVFAAHDCCCRRQVAAAEPDLGDLSFLRQNLSG